MNDPVEPGQGDPTPEAAQQPSPPAQQPEYSQMQYSQTQYSQPQYLPPQPAEAPPHPYAVPRTQPSQGRGIAIAAMALGLAAVVTVLVAVVYIPIALVLGTGFAIAAVVLGGVAIARRGPRAPGVTGLVSGAVAIVLTVGMVAVGAGSLGVQAIMGVASQVGADSPEQGGPGVPSDPGTTPHDEAAVDIEWPANLATGGIMFTGDDDGSMRVVETESLPDNAFPDISELAAESGGQAPDRIQLYLDYRCPACLTFEQTNGDTLEKAAHAGAVVELQPLTFLDGASADSYYSSRVSGAMACLAENQPEIAWAAHVALLSNDFQPAGNIPGPNNAELIAHIDDSAGKLNGDARSCIAEEEHVLFAQALSNWISTNPVPRAEIPDLRVQGTPLTLVNGVAFDGDISDADAFTTFLAQQGVALE